MKSAISLVKAFAAAVPMLFAAGHAQAAAWPDRPVTLVVPYTPGGVTDALARVVATGLAKRLKEAVVVENRAGGGANIGAAMVARANPDGYTLLMGSAATHAINSSLYKKLSYDPIKDFEPISLVAKVPNVLVVNPSVPAHNVKELIAYAKAHPGQLNFGSSGVGGTIHLSGELFKSMAGVQMTHVPYKGSAPAVADLLGGQIQVMFDSSVVPYVKAGKLRALGVTSAKRSPALPDVPTIAEAGLPGYEATAWFGVLAPAGTPEPIIAKLNTEISAVLRDPAVTKWMAGQGFEAEGGSPADFAAHIRNETAKWARIVKECGATAE
jgi:tripartite-type tricarboxylate transporter receptor subunit TctC